MTNRVNTKEEAMQRLIGAKKKIASLGVIGIGLLGSLVTGRQSSTSDIDILVEFAPDHHSFDNFMDLSFFLEDLLGRKVKLVTHESLSPHIGPRILAEVQRVPVAA